MYLFVKKKTDHQSLDQFTEDLSNSLGCPKWEQRFSSNYPPEERYFRCFVLGMEIIAAITDYAEYSAFDFGIIFKREIYFNGDKNALDGIADCTARKLAVNGYDVLYVLDMGRTAPKNAIIYKRNPAKDPKAGEQVITKNFLLN